MVKRYAFTMIELIFAIVVIAIAIVSLPVMTQTSDKNIEANIIQEAIFASETLLNESAAYYWDVQSRADQGLTGDENSRVIDTYNDCNATSRQRIGHLNRRCLNNSAIGPDNNDTIGISIDFISNSYGTPTDLFNDHNSTTATATYKDGYKVTANINQCTTIGAGGCNVAFDQNTTDRDLKEVQLTIQDSSGTVRVIVRAYSANIGEAAIINNGIL